MIDFSSRNNAIKGSSIYVFLIMSRNDEFYLIIVNYYILELNNCKKNTPKN